MKHAESPPGSSNGSTSGSMQSPRSLISLFNRTATGPGNSATASLKEHNPRLGRRATPTSGNRSASRLSESSLDALSMTVTSQRWREPWAASSTEGRHSANSREPL